MKNVVGRTSRVEECEVEDHENGESKAIPQILCSEKNE